MRTSASVQTPAKDEGRSVQFHANHVSVSAEGDYYRMLFEAVLDSQDPESPYLVIQRQFEEPDGGRCYVETRDENYIGHFRIRRIDLSFSRIVLEIDRPKDSVVEISFAIASSDFKEVARFAGIISGVVEAP
jgi:hypothetical protein